MSISTLSIGIVGLPNVGKSTLFNALLKRQAALAANYPFATIEPNIGVVDVPESRLDRLIEVVKTDYGSKMGDREIPEKVVPATIKFYDIAGLVKGASQGEGLGNAFLGHIREVDAIVHVVRAFTDENVIRAGSTSPQEDIETINTELILSDLQALDKRLMRLEREAKLDKSDKTQLLLATLTKIKIALDNNKLANELELSKDGLESVGEINLLTLKPVIYVYNIDEKDLGTNIARIKENGVGESIFISAQIESEIASINNTDERKEFLETLGIKESGLDQIIRKGYSVLGLETFFTIGPKEVHAWTIKKGSTAPQAAGRIHTDFERGFISAQVVGYDDLNKFGSEKTAKTQGLVRLEGKTYIVRDGDVVEFNFSV